MTVTVVAAPPAIFELTLAGVLFVAVLVFTLVAAFREELLKQCPSPVECRTCSPFRRAIHVLALYIDRALKKISG